jgi:hypothetical protein
MSADRLGKMLTVAGVLVSWFLVASASAESKARIVRLSEVQGRVQIDRAAGAGYEKAFLNLPVVEGSKLKTGRDGRAEVEFEDGSALRLAQDSEIRFTMLGLGDGGQKLSTVQLIFGTMYVNVHGSKGDQLQVNFGRESMTLTEAAHLRIELGDTEATLALFKGKLSGSGPSGQFEVAEKHSATFDLANNDSFALRKNYEQDPNDAWDKQQSEYHDRYATSKTYDMSSPYAYGLSDLNYYGNYMMVPGYGWVWQPYLAGAGWSPFQDGAWAWYPGFGYMWVSGYPWGWMPYYYGNWGFAPAYGWFWQPGYWNAWVPVPPVVNAPVRTPLPQPPIRGHQTVLVGRGLVAYPARPSSRLSINPGSAGLGVPRGSVRDFSRVAKEAANGTRPVVVHTQPSISSPNYGGGTWGSGARGSSVSGGSRMSGPAAHPPSPPPSRGSTPHR